MTAQSPNALWQVTKPCYINHCRMCSPSPTPSGWFPQRSAQNTLRNHFLMVSKPKMDILNKTGGVVSIYKYNPLKQRADCDLFVFNAYKGCLHIFDAPFLLQATSLRKDMRRRGPNCSGRICHTLQVRAPTLTSHACICTGLNSWQNQLFYSRWVCLPFSHLYRS